MLSLGPILFWESGLMEVKNSFFFYRLYQSFSSHLGSHLTYLIFSLVSFPRLLIFLRDFPMSNFKGITGRWIKKQGDTHPRMPGLRVIQKRVGDSWGHTDTHRHLEVGGRWHGSGCARGAGDVTGRQAAWMMFGSWLGRYMCAHGECRQAHQRFLGRRLGRGECHTQSDFIGKGL